MATKRQSARKPEALRKKRATIRRVAGKQGNSEKALRESEEKYRTLFETMAQGVAYHAADGTIISANPSAKRILGLSLTRTQGRTFACPHRKAIHEDGSDFPGETHPSIVALKTGKKVPDVVMGVFNPIKQRYVWINVTAIPQFKTGERFPYQVYTTLKDITFRKESEEILRASERRFRELFNHTSSGVAVYEALADGEDFLVVDLNHAGEKMEKVRKKEIIGKKVTEVFPGVREFGLLDVFQRVWRTGKTERHPVSLYKDSRIMGWKENVVYRLPSHEVVAVYEDVTERKRAEEALRESEMRYRTFIDATSDMVFLKDEFFRYLISNGANSAFLGQSEVAVLGCTDFDLMTEEAAKHCRASDREALEREGVVTAEETVGPNTYQTIKFPVPLLGGRVGVGGYIRDITERKRAEEEIRTLSLTDDLTGLYNRRAFFVLAKQQLRIARRTKREMFLFYADIDDLKRINDKFGHREGDAALIDAAVVFKKTFRESDIIARIGGDEFIVLITDAIKSKEVLMKRLQANLEVHNLPENRKYRLCLSIGVTLCDSQHPRSLDDLIAQADKLMYDQKGEGRKKW